jgi:uncharacterized protein YciI
MSLFVMIGRDRPDSAERRVRNREQHLAHISTLDREGRIAYAGPIRDDADERSIGSVIVLSAASMEEARSLVDRDPYVTAGVFESVSVNVFKQVLPAES